MKNEEWSEADIPDQGGKFIVLSGATSGIGKEVAKAAAAKNARIVCGVRDLVKAEAIGREILSRHPQAQVSFLHLDLCRLESVKSFAAKIRAEFPRIDVLINNAGVMMCPFSRTFDGFEIQIGINHLSHFALTGQLLEHQQSNGRIVAVSSLGHFTGRPDLSDLNWERRRYNSLRAYWDSKLVNLSFVFELVRRLRDREIKVVASHPGWTKTGLQRHSRMLWVFNLLLAQDVTIGALPILRAAFDDQVVTGDYFGPSRFFEMHGSPTRVGSSKRAHDPELARIFWERSEEFTGVRFS